MTSGARPYRLYIIYTSPERNNKHRPWLETHISPIFCLVFIRWGTEGFQCCGWWERVKPPAGTHGSLRVTDWQGDVVTHTLTWKWTLHLRPHRTEQTTFLVTVVAEVESLFSEKKNKKIMFFSSQTSNISQPICLGIDLISFCILPTKFDLFPPICCLPTHNSSPEMYA